MKQFLFISCLCLTLLFAAEPPPFDYYMLALSWAPAFCAQPGEAAKNPLECNTGHGFVIHGLWPEANQGRVPESCGPSKNVPRGLVNDMLKYMPSPSLIQYEWATHGTCTGLNQQEYFTRIMLARAAIQIPVQISSLAQTVRETPAEIESQFANANPAFPKDAFRVACRAEELTEVRACFDKNLKPRACTASAGECTSQSLTIRTPR
jgi:ribonuclease T2